MATLGQKLKAAREAKGITESEAGSATKILSRIILAMERDDFSDMPAPAYARGFIRLYAGYLGLDPEPLVQEYMETHAAGPKPAAEGETPSEQPVPAGSPSTFSLSAITNLGSWFSKGGKGTGGLLQRFNLAPLRDIRVLAAVIAGLLVLLILIASISNCARRRAAARTAPPASASASSRALINDPAPDIYLVETGKVEIVRP